MIAKAPKSGVVLSNSGAKKAKGSVGNTGRPIYVSRGEKRIICTLNVDVRHINLLLSSVMIVGYSKGINAV